MFNEVNIITDCKSYQEGEYSKEDWECVTDITPVFYFVCVVMVFWTIITMVKR